MFQLPQHIINKIFQYDSTYHEHYKKVLHEISMFPIWNTQNKNNTRYINCYYNLTIAKDMIKHWEHYHYTYFINSLTDNSNNEIEGEKRYLINYLYTNSIRNKIYSHQLTLFEWIKYYNKIRSV